MRQPVRHVVDSLAGPDPLQRSTAAAAFGAKSTHDTLMHQWSCMNEIEAKQPSDETTLPDRLIVTAWNIERCKDVEASAERLRLLAADVVLATEMDWGMARSGQRHTTADLASALGFGYVFGVEFVELGLGDPWETSLCAGMTNDQGLHGNAILSRFPLHDPALIPIDEGGAWFVRAPKDDGQYRVGGRMAMTARIDTQTGPVGLASVHYESESDADGRAEQTRMLLQQQQGLYGDQPLIIGGDLNTKGFSDAGMTPDDILADAERVEPAFTHMARCGLDWRTCNLGHVTTRKPPWIKERKPLMTLDWLFVRGVNASDPFVEPALSTVGKYLSDHEIIGTKITS